MDSIKSSIACSKLECLFRSADGSPSFQGKIGSRRGGGGVEWCGGLYGRPLVPSNGGDLVIEQ
jgi:hypothetical protein